MGAGERITPLRPFDELAPGVIPPEVSADDVVIIPGHAEALEVLRSSKVASLPEGPETPVVGGRLDRLNGETHTLRRRAFNRAFRREALHGYRTKITLPAIERNLSRALASAGPGGVARADLVDLIRRVLVEFAVNMVGLHKAEDITEQHITELLEQTTLFEAAVNVAYAKGTPQDKLNIVSRALEAKRQYAARHYEPAFGALNGTGELGYGGESPEHHNLLTIVARKLDPAHEDHDLGIRDTIFLLAAGVDSTTNTTISTFAELSEWFSAHPEDYGLRTDIEFLTTATAEDIRRNFVESTSQTRRQGFALVRIATEDFTLSTGRQMKAGQWIIMNMQQLNHDESVFGPDADVFNPRRNLPANVPRYGLGFGAGSHLCIGQPVVMGVDGTDGVIPHILRSLYLAGAERDPERAPTLTDIDVLLWQTFPVVFSPAARESARAHRDSNT